jgi:protein MpaA
MGAAMRRTWWWVLLLVAGCASPEDGASAPVPGPKAPPRSERVIGKSVEGRPIRLVVLGDGPDTVLLLASIHGRESAGTPLLIRLEARLLEEPALLAGRRVLLVPEANPDGMARGTRGNARGVDLNRNFPAENFRPGPGGPEPLSEPESRALAAVIREHRPERVVTLHEPIAVVDYDGPGRDLAHAMGRACRLPVRKLGARPGSLGSWVGITLETPIVTLELPRTARTTAPEALWTRHGPALLTAVTGGEPPVKP